MRICCQLIQESKIKCKTVMSWSPQKRKEGIFCSAYLVRREFILNIYVLSQCIVYWIHLQNKHTFTYQKTLLHSLSEAVTRCVLLKKGVEGLRTCSFIKKRLQHRCFLVKFMAFLKTPILKNNWEQLLLHFCFKIVKGLQCIHKHFVGNALSL